MHITHPEALHKLHQLAAQHAPLFHTAANTRSVSLDDAIGCVAATAYRFPAHVPAQPTSAMDGYCVNSACTAAATATHPVELTVLGCIAAGDDVTQHQQLLAELQHTNAAINYAYEIMTGAVVPQCRNYFDAVVKVEDTIRDGQRQCRHQTDDSSINQAAAYPHAITLSQPTAAHRHTRLAGEDFHANDMIVEQHTTVTAESVALLATAGINTITVCKQLRAAVITTGSELIVNDGSRASQRCDAGQVYNSNAAYLTATLKHHYHVDAQYIGNVQDDAGQLVDALYRCIVRPTSHERQDAYDVIITTGAVSAGKFDLVPLALKRLNCRLAADKVNDQHSSPVAVHQLFHHVQLRPGHPILVANVSHHSKGSSRIIPIFCLPGTPIAVIALVRFFIAPYMQMLLRPDITVDNLLRDHITLPLSTSSTLPKHFNSATVLMPASIVEQDGTAHAVIAVPRNKSTMQGKSSALASIQAATHWMLVDGSTNSSRVKLCALHAAYSSRISSNRAHNASKPSNHSPHSREEPHSQLDECCDALHHKRADTPAEDDMTHHRRERHHSLAAIILCGGRSSRMGRDKALLVSPNQQVQLHRCISMARQAGCTDVFVSCRANQVDALQSHVDSDATHITFVTDDTNLGDIGPAAGLLSVLHRVTEPMNTKATLKQTSTERGSTNIQQQLVANAYLVLAVDFPLMQYSDLVYLVDQHFGSGATANLLTCYIHPEDDMPEPLCSIWTLPALYALHYNSTVDRRTGPCHTIKQLKQQSPGLIQYVKPLTATTLYNANTPAEYAHAVTLSQVVN